MLTKDREAAGGGGRLLAHTGEGPRHRLAGGEGRLLQGHGQKASLIYAAFLIVRPAVHQARVLSACNQRLAGGLAALITASLALS